MKYGKDHDIEIRILKKNNAFLTKFFRCGNIAIDEYFRTEAPEDTMAVTYIYIDKDNYEPIACATISCSAIFTHSEEDGEDIFSTLLPAMEIKYLGVDDRYKHIPYTDESQRPTLSDVIFDNLICDIMMNIANEHIGASKIVLYSVPEALTFYERHGFKPFDDSMYGDKGYNVDGCEPMYFDLFTDIN